MRSDLPRDGNSGGSRGPELWVSAVSDRVLWDRARQGDAAAFGELFERHAAKIYNYCFRRTADWALAEDLTSASFLIAWRSVGRESLRAESALPGNDRQVVTATALPPRDIPEHWPRRRS